MKKPADESEMRVKIRATGFAVLRGTRTTERAWFFAEGEKSEGGASE
jgi:hypothetical protein